MMHADPFSSIHNSLLTWYKHNARSLPWRNIDDPYLTWISEVMLQQTQVNTVIPYFNMWKERFPDLLTLGSATEEEVLKTWEGLGYYSRARNIKKAADTIIKDFGGNIPEDISNLRSLPGIGEYIAAAIASIAFGKSVPALEANGLRVIARIFDFHGEIQRSRSRKVLSEKLRGVIMEKDAGSINQSIMDLGSMICLPKDPLCEGCPIRAFCMAHAHGTQNELPVKKKKSPVPHVIVVAAVIKKKGSVLVTKRPADKMLGGLWEFPGGKVEKGETHEEALQRELKEEIGVNTTVHEQMQAYEHAYTHFSVTVYTYRTEIVAGKIINIEVADSRWVEIPELEKMPMGKVDRMISRDLL